MACPRRAGYNVCGSPNLVRTETAMHRVVRAVLSALLVSSVACDDDPDAGGVADTDAPDVAVDTASDVAPDAPDDAAGDTIDEAETTPEICEPAPGAEAELPAGAEVDGTVLAPGGRALGAPGVTIPVPGFPSNVVLSDDGAHAWVLTASNDDRAVLAIDVASGEVTAQIDVADAFHGLALSPDGARLFASGGGSGVVHVFDVAEDGGIALVASVDVDTYVSGLALSADGATLWVGAFDRARVLAFDVATFVDGSEPRVLSTRYPVWDVLPLPDGRRLAVSTLQGTGVQLLPADGSAAPAPIELGRSPMGMVVTPDGSGLWVVVSGADEVVRIALDNSEVIARGPITGGDLVDADGAPLPRSNGNDLTLTADGTRLLVSRGADNAVSVLSAADLSFEGAFPTAWYPTAVLAAPTGGGVIVTEGKGFGSGPSEGTRPRNQLDGSVSIVDLDAIDLAASTADVSARFTRPTDVFPFDCAGQFPVPTRPDMPSPIEHIILVVKENKTFDCVFGDLEGMDVDVDPTLVRWGEEITPNQHQLARDFAISDNFYVEVENSDMGHIWLTAGFMTEFAERVWLEKVRTGQFQGFQLDEASIPEPGNLFTHLLDHDVDIRIYGEIVGMLAQAADGTEPITFSDGLYPGGPFYNMDARDSARAEYVVDRINEGDFATFTYMLLPNDHTGGTAPGNPTPEAEVADNDEAVGILVDGLSRTEYWDRTLIIVVEDDPQGCMDHVDTHRSFVLFIGPWARRGYVSHVNASFPALMSTILRVLGVPPMGRPDAAAPPMYDMFAATPDTTPWTYLPRRIAEEKILDIRTPGAEASMRMDFRGPDRNPDMGVVLDAYRLWRMGRISRDEAQQRIDQGIMSMPAGALDDEEREEIEEERLEEALEEALEERYAFDLAFERYARWLRQRGEPVPALTRGPLDDRTIERVMQGELDPTQLPWFDNR